MGLINIHNHIHLPDAQSAQLLHIELKLDDIMTKQERFDTILTRLDSVTTNLAGDFATFIKEYKEGTVSEESLAKAEAGIVTLEALAATKENPIPGEDIPPVTE